jgi:hypothetical protein
MMDDLFWIRRLLALDRRRIYPRPRFFLRTTDAWLSQAPPLILARPRRRNTPPVLLKSE